MSENKKGKKRKASSLSANTAAIGLGSVDLQALSVQDIAVSLVSLLPKDATEQNPTSKKLLQAVDLVKHELKTRSHAAAREVVSVGSFKPFQFCGGQVALPQVAVLQILGYFTHYEFTHKLGLVDKAWLSATRLPQLWTHLNNKTGFLEFRYRKVQDRAPRTMTDVQAILKRPQFVALTSLVLPENIKLEANGLKKIAKFCPLLEELDLGHENTGLKAKDEHILSLPELFPNLSKIGLDMWNITDGGICQLCRAMGQRLLELKVRNDCITGHYLSNETLAVMGGVCPNLTKFGYFIRTHMHDPVLDGLTSAGVKTLLMGCVKLEALFLAGTDCVSLVDGTFEALTTDPNLGANLNFLVLHGCNRRENDNSLLGDQGDHATRIREGLDQKVRYCRWEWARPYLDFDEKKIEILE